MGQLNGAGNVYLPDYSVRQLTHLQIIKVTPEQLGPAALFPPFIQSVHFISLANVNTHRIRYHKVSVLPGDQFIIIIIIQIPIMLLCVR